MAHLKIKTFKSFVISGRRVDSLELRMAGNDQANRALLEQLMKLNQDIKVGISSRKCHWCIFT